MKLILQPEGSSICGQCCVAMITGLPLKSVIATFCREDLGTGPRIVRWVLKYYHYKPNKRLLRFKKQSQLPALCMLKLTYRFQKIGHWVVYDTGDIYCPVHGICCYEDYEELAGGTLTHYLGFTK
jgi:hypothetical protein